MHHGGRLFAELIARWQTRGGDVTSAAREAQAILDRYEADARDIADRLIVEARIEAARLITDARREAGLITERTAALQQAHQDAALALEQSRRALEASVAGSPGLRGATGADLRPPVTNWPTPGTTPRTRAVPAARPAAARILRRRAPSRRVLMTMLGGVALAVLVAVPWFGRALLPSTATVASDAAINTDGTDVPTDGTTGQADPGAARPGAVTIVLEARRPSWVRATRDGKAEAGYTLQAGQRRRITASERVAIRAGDAGALLVSVNGGEPARFGRDGRPLTREFGSQGRPDPTPPAGAAASLSLPGEPAYVPAASVHVSRDAAHVPDVPDAGSPQSVRLPRNPSPGNAEQEILQIDRQWFDSFYRGDQAAMARLTAPGFEIVDTRTPAEQGWATGAPPERLLTHVRIDVHGDGAVLSARMTERQATNGTPRTRESYISEVWVRRGGFWQLLGLRMASGSEVQQAADALR